MTDSDNGALGETIGFLILVILFAVVIGYMLWFQGEARQAVIDCKESATLCAPPDESP